MVMNMYSKIKEVFHKERISNFGIISSYDMTIINPHLMPENTDIKSCIVFLVPYKADYTVYDNLGVSLFARSMDYHIFFRLLYKRIIPILEDMFTGEHFYGFADHSPINEKLAAAKAGLGVIGRNSLLINKEYGSYVFIGSILTTLSLPYHVSKINSCINCKKCIDACPTGAISDKGIIPELCLSAISQKKKKSADEFKMLRDNNIVWGCDICQNICPMNENKKATEFEFFHTNRLNNITGQFLEEMPKKIFCSYPFSWRGKNSIIQNINNITKKMKSNK